MEIFNMLSPNRKRFLNELGISKDKDIPESFFDVIQSYNDNFSEGERFCLNDYNISFCEKSVFSIRDVVGSNHQRYANKTWLEAFMDLDRGEELLSLYFSNHTYYDEVLKRKESPNIGLAYKNGKYFILDSAGGGNNRMILMKIKYLALASKDACDLTILDKYMSFYGNIRTAPSEKASDAIFHLIFPNGGFKESGYFVLNKTTDINHPVFSVVRNYPTNTTPVFDTLTEEELLKIASPENDSIKKL